MKRPILLLAEDHRIVTGSVQVALARWCDVVRCTPTGSAVREAIERLHPSVVVLDTSLADLNWSAVGRRPSGRRRPVFLFVTQRARSALLGELLAQVRRCVSTGPQLVHAVEGALAGRRSPARPGPEPKLTPRQQDVLRLVAEGYNVKRIAAELGLALKTVEFHKRRLQVRLGLHGTAELTRWAVGHGIVLAYGEPQAARARRRPRTAFLEA